MKKEIEHDEKLVACCGFYCGACPKYKTGKHNCQGCRGGNPLCLDACTVRPCVIAKGYLSCAECKQFDSVVKCKKYNPFMIRFGEFITRTSRRKCIELIKGRGKTWFVDFMCQREWVTFKKNNKE